MIERIVTGFLNTNTYIYSRWKKGCIIIDPGGNYDDIILQLQKKNFTPLALICTHGHFDHIAGIPPLLSHYRELDIHIPVYIHQADAKYLGQNAENAHLQNFETLGIEYNPLTHGFIEDLPEPEAYLNEGESLLDTDLQVLHTPGHTKGSVSLYSEHEGILFSGDALFFEGIGRTDLPEGDLDELVSGIREKLYSLPAETRVFPGHGPFTTVEREKNHNPFVSEN